MRRERIRRALQWRDAGARRRRTQFRRHEIGTEDDVDAQRREIAQQGFDGTCRGRRLARGSPLRASAHGHHERNQQAELT